MAKKDKGQGLQNQVHPKFKFNHKIKEYFYSQHVITTSKEITKRKF